MKLDGGTSNVATAGTRVQLSSDAGINVTDRIIWAKFTPREGNTGEVYVGISDVSATHGVELDPGGANKQKDELVLNPGAQGGSIPASSIYFDADTDDNKVDWALLIAD